MNSAPRLSIVTISFNQRRFLKQTLESVLAEKTPAVEYIVVDPGSTDGSRELLQEYAGSIDHLILEPDAGPADGLNKGFARARGEIGYFLNSDDFLLPGAIGAILRHWENPAASVLLGGGWIVDGAGEPVREVWPNRAACSLKGHLSGWTVFFQQGMTFRMEEFRRVGGFNAGNRSCWDGELLVDLLLHDATAKLIPVKLGAFRIHSESITGGVGGATMARRMTEDRALLRRKIENRLNMTGQKLSFVERVVFFVCSRTLSGISFLDRKVGFFLRRRWRSDVKARPS